MMIRGARFVRTISVLATLGAMATVALSAAADTPPTKDYVDLADGSRIEGTIVDLKTGTAVTLELSPGVRTTIPWASVKRVGHAQAPGGAAAPAVAAAPAPVMAAAPPPPPPAPLPAPAAPAPGNDVVALKDGTRITGKIVDQQPGKYVVIQTASGTRTLTWDGISEVTSGVAVAAAPPPPPAPAPAPVAPPPPPAPSAPATPAPAAADATPPPPAAAEEPTIPMTGPWILSFDRLFGLGAWTVTQSQSGQSQSTNGISFSALVGTTTPDGVPAIVYHTPRLALDYKLGQGPSGVTMGGSLGFFLGNSSVSPPGGGSSTSGPGLNMYLVELRGGYYWAFDKRWAFWPRGGLSFFQYSQSSSPSGGGQSVSQSASGIAIDIEPTIVLRALPSFGVTASALADIGVGGSASATGSSSIGLTSTNFGLTFGALASF
jgi:hypothetical protein